MEIKLKLILLPLDACLPVGRGGVRVEKMDHPPTFILPRKAGGKFSYDG